MLVGTTSPVANNGRGRRWRLVVVIGLAVAAGAGGMVVGVWQLPLVLYPNERGQPRATLQAGMLAVLAAAITLGGVALTLVVTRKANRQADP
jgi:hypothetical protein